MENVCKPLEGKQFDQEHIKTVENHINSNPKIFNPLPEIIDTNQSTIDEIESEITVAEIKSRIKSTPNKAPGDKIFAQHLKNGTEKLFKIIAIIFNSSL